MKFNLLVATLVFFLLILIIADEAGARRLRRPEPRFSYFGGGPLLLEYEKYSEISDRSSSDGFQLTGGLMWDYFGLEVRLAPETINRYRFEFDGQNEKVDLELDHRLSILVKPALPLERTTGTPAWIYGIGGPVFGDVQTVRDSGTTTMKASETDLVFGAGAAVKMDRMIYQVDWLTNINRDDRAFSGVYFGFHYLFDYYR